MKNFSCLLIYLISLTPPETETFDVDNSLKKSSSEDLLRFYRCTFIYIYIYIYSNLISTSIHGTRKKKKKPWPGTREKSISNHRPGEKEKNFGSKRKKRPTSSDPLKKIKRYAVSGQKKTKKPSANTAMLQLLKCSTLNNGANYRINLNR